MRMLSLGWKYLRMWVLTVVLLGYESNSNRLRVWEKVDWMACHTCNTPIFRVWATKNQWLWALFSLSILWRRMERSKKCKPSDSPAPWSLDTTWNGEMVEVGKIFCCRLLGWLYTKRRRQKIAEVQRKGVLVAIARMILWTTKGVIGTLKLTELEELLFAGDGSIGCMYKKGCENEGALTIL